MKQILLLTLFFVTQYSNSFSQDVIPKDPLSQLVIKYEAISNALVNGNSSTASIAAGQFIETLNSIDYKKISEGNANSMLADATAISVSKDLQAQRASFAKLSISLTAIARNIQLTKEPVYLAYCPMKKAYWLTSVNEIRNPYYGKSMLTCGEIQDTIKH